MSEELKHKIYTATECLSEQTMFDYIDHKLSAKERHVVEKHMLDCELCSDAMEGLELVKDRNRISVINKAVDEFIAPIAEKETKIISINYKTVFSIAAGIALLIGGIFFFKNFTSSQMKSSEFSEVLPPKDQTPPPPPPPKETEETPASSASPAKEAPAVTADNASAITETDAPSITNEREQGPQTKSPGLKSKEGQLESTEDLKQNIALAEGKEKDKKEPFKTTVVTGAITKAPASSGKTYDWSANDNTVNGAKSDDAVAKQEDDRKPTPASPESTTVNAPMGGAGESTKNQVADESKKAEEKVVAHNNNVTATPSYGYATTQTAKPDQNQEQKNDKSNLDGDQIALAKKSEKSGKYRAESESKDKDKLAANKQDADAAGSIAYEPKSVGAANDKEVAKTEIKTAPVTAVNTSSNTTVDGLFYKENADSVYAIAVVDKMPEYPDGQWEMTKFILRNFNHAPIKAYGETFHNNDSIAPTKIYVQFIVGKDGVVRNPKITKGLTPAIDKEALRVVLMMPKWKPGTKNGKPASVIYNIPIQLNLKD